MRIGIYNEPAGSALGGAELSVAILAEALGNNHAVEVIHHHRGLSAQTLGAFSGTNLSNIRLKYLPVSPVVLGDSWVPWRRHREAREWQADLSKPYELFVTFAHGIPPFCHASRGALVVLFPLYVPFHRTSGRTYAPWQAARRLYSRLEWRARIGSYAAVIAISRYTKRWVRERWDVDASVAYPPADPLAVDRPKERLILSVGRFASTGHVKCQSEMIEAFSAWAPAGWQYVSAGALGDSAADRTYFETVQRAASASGLSISVEVNIDRRVLHDVYGRARLFWHAAGFANSENKPELNEHFGITTVEAMSAGCVPLAFNRGGQAEIIEHGVSGFLWNTVEELLTYSRRLACDDELWSKMSAAARRRAAAFDRTRYVETLVRQLGLNSVANNSGVARW